jgi:hypothetical protein
MPFTPFHLGPALLLKAAAPRHVSFTAFAASQVAIDLESLYYLMQRAWPVHRIVHTFAVAVPVGVASGALACLTLAALVRLLRIEQPDWLRNETELRCALVGGFAGGVTHPFFDAIMHTDIRPFAPFSPENPLLGIVGLERYMSAAWHSDCLAGSCWRCVGNSDEAAALIEHLKRAQGHASARPTLAR